MHVNGCHSGVWVHYKWVEVKRWGKLDFRCMHLFSYFSSPRFRRLFFKAKISSLLSVKQSIIVTAQPIRIVLFSYAYRLSDYVMICRGVIRNISKRSYRVGLTSRNFFTSRASYVAAKKQAPEKKTEINKNEAVSEAVGNEITTDPQLDLKLLSHFQYLSDFYSPRITEQIMRAESVVKPSEYANRKFDPTVFAPHYLDDLIHDDTKASTLAQNSDDFMSLPKPSASLSHQKKVGANNSEETSEMQELARQLSLSTHLDADYIQKLSSKTLILKTVRNQTSKGKINSFYALVCAGDRNGMLGIGEGKDPEEPNMAILKAHWQAVKNLVAVPRFERRTIYGSCDSKYGATIVQLRSSPAGSGLRCNPMIFELAQCAGIKDLSANVYRSRNKMNVGKCTMQALLSQKSTEQVERERGKKLVSLRQAYYSGN